MKNIIKKYIYKLREICIENEDYPAVHITYESALFILQKYNIQFWACELLPCFNKLYLKHIKFTLSNIIFKKDFNQTVVYVGDFMKTKNLINDKIMIREIFFANEKLITIYKIGGVKKMVLPYQLTIFSSDNETIESFNRRLFIDLKKLIDIIINS